MKTAVIGLAFLALAPTASWADFNIDGFTAGMTETEALAKLRAEGLVPKPPLVPELSDGHEFETGPYTFFFCKNDRLVSLSKTITVKEFNAKLLETLRLRGQPTVDIPNVPNLSADTLWLRWGSDKTNDFVSLTISGPDEFHNESTHIWESFDNSVCSK